LIDFGPRSKTAGALPGRPLVWTIWTPGTLPASCDSTFVAPGTGISLWSMWATVNGRFFCSVPAVTPVTTTSASRLTSSFSEKFTDCAPGVMLMRRTVGARPNARARKLA